MAMEIASGATVALAAVGTGGEMYEQDKAAKEQLQQIQLEQKQNELQYQQKMISNYDVMQKVLDAQTAQATVRGVSLGSASFNAIQRGAYNTGAKTAQNLDTEKSLEDQNSDIERQNVKKSLHAQLFGDVLNFSEDALSFITGIPMKGSSKMKSSRSLDSVQSGLDAVSKKRRGY